jgi:hypothetical protein
MVILQYCITVPADQDLSAPDVSASAILKLLYLRLLHYLLVKCILFNSSSCCYFPNLLYILAWGVRESANMHSLPCT